jgi:bifunctional non-homologous end joining protein LigD
MKATSGTLPTGADWTYELKWDGMRAIAEITAGELRLWSTNAKDATVSFPELRPLGAAFGHLDVVLDGEIVALDPAGLPDFGRLQQRMHISAPSDAARRATEVPVELVLFDVLRVGRRETIDLPLSDRRALLVSLTDDLPGGVEVAGSFTDGVTLLAAAKREGMEGLVAKRVGSRYLPGRRTTDWIKVKLQRRQEMVVGGWATGQGERSGTLGSLLVGYNAPADAPADQRTLRYGGRVGTGFTGAVLAQLRDRLADLATDTCPFTPPPPRERLRDAHWVRPELVAEVGFGNWTDEGLLRHPVYLGLRADKDPRDVVREP